MRPEIGRRPKACLENGSARMAKTLLFYSSLAWRFRQTFLYAIGEFWQ